MVRDVLQSIENVELWPVIGLVLFLAAAALVTIWVVRLDKQDVERFSRLPLDSDTDAPSAPTANSGSK